MGARNLSLRDVGAIMRDNIITIEDSVRIFGDDPPKAQLELFDPLKLDADVLEMCRDTHVLAAVFQRSVLGVRRVAEKVREGRSDLFWSFDSQDWYRRAGFAQNQGEAGWHLVSKERVSNSLNKSWHDQLKTLPAGEESVGARVLIYTMIAHFLKTGERLFEDGYVRVKDLDNHGKGVTVGDFCDRDHGDDMILDSYRREESRIYLGLASQVKIPRAA